MSKFCRASYRPVFATFMTLEPTDYPVCLLSDRVLPDLPFGGLALPPVSGSDFGLAANSVIWSSAAAAASKSEAWTEALTSSLLTPLLIRTKPDYAVLSFNSSTRASIWSCSSRNKRNSSFLPRSYCSNSPMRAPSFLRFLCKISTFRPASADASRLCSSAFDSC